MQRSDSRPFRDVPTQPDGTAAFTRLDALAVTAVLALLALLTVPVLAGGKQRSLLTVCQNNLSRIGQAFQVYNSEHGQTDPWRVLRTSENPATGLEPNAWYQYMQISNELRSTSVLFCPTDIKRFTENPGPYSYISYFLGVDSSPALPQSVLAGDWNISTSVSGTYCSIGHFGLPGIASGGTRVTSWQSRLHGRTVGNLLFHDGHVEQRANEGLNEAFLNTPPDSAPGYPAWHLVVPPPIP